jgi:hypothetical protein
MAKVIDDPTTAVSEGTARSQEIARHLRWVQEMDQLAKAAVREAQEENRRLGIATWYEVNGQTVSDQQDQS